MTVALLVALLALSLGFLVVMDRQSKRHHREVERVLQYRADPKLAALADMPSAEVLYLRPDDDEAWNERHGKDA